MSYYKVADLYFSMNSFGITEKNALPWLIQQPMGISFEISVVPFLHKEDSNESYLEYFRTELEFNRHLLNHQGFLLHASAISFHGKAYCFCGWSGTGKSTHTANWLKVFGEEQVCIINDDKPALRLVDGKWFAYGTPWSGKTNTSRNIKCPIGAIFILKQAEYNAVKTVSNFEKVKSLNACLEAPMLAAERSIALQHMDKLIDSIPIFGLACRPDEEAVWTAYQAIIEEEEKEK